MSEHGSPCWYEDQASFMEDFDSPKQNSQPNMAYHLSYACKKELDLQYQFPHEHFLQLPLLESPKLLQTPGNVNCNPMAAYTFQSSSLIQEEHIQQPHEQSLHPMYGRENTEPAADQVTDWRVLDKFVASQLSQDDIPQENNYSNGGNSCQVDLWKQ